MVFFRLLNSLRMAKWKAHSAGQHVKAAAISIAEHARAALLDGVHNRGEIVVQQNDVSSLARHVGSALRAHCGAKAVSKRKQAMS